MKRKIPPEFIAFICFVVFIVLVASIQQSWGTIQEWRRQAKLVSDADALVSKTVDAIQVDKETGRWSQKTEMPVDPWGHPLWAEYEEGEINDYVTIKSAGPDGVKNTEDDIQHYRFRPSVAVTTSTVNKEVGRHFKNAKDSLKEKIFGKEEE